MAMRTSFTKQLSDLEALVGRFGEACCSDVRAAGLACAGDKGAEAGVLAGRKTAERLRSEIEGACLDTMLLQQPIIGGDLRFVTSTFRIVSDMAHIDSMARDVAFILSELPEGVEGKLSDAFMAMSARAAAMIEGAVAAFLAADEAHAREVIAADDELDRMYAEAQDGVVGLIRAGDPPARVLPELLMVAKYFERIGDNAQRIANWAVFRASGERILDGGARVHDMS